VGNVDEGSPLTTAGAPLANTQKMRNELNHFIHESRCIFLH